MTRDAYGVQSLIYDRVLEPVNAPLRAVGHRVLPPVPGETVLDIGCGTGTALEDFHAAGCRVLGTDPSPAMLARAKARLGDRADLRLMEGDHVPFEDHVADRVVVSLVLHSVSPETGAALLTEVARVLAPDGTALITDFGTGALRFPRGWLTRALTAVAELAAGPAHARHAVEYLRSGGLTPLLGESLVCERVKVVAGGNIAVSVLRRA